MRRATPASEAARPAVDERGAITRPTGGGRSRTNRPRNVPRRPAGHDGNR